MNHRLLLSAAACLGLLAALADPARAAENCGVTSATTTPGTTTSPNASTNVKVKIQELRRGRKWKDLHIYPPIVEGFPKPELPDLKEKTKEVPVKKADGSAAGTWKVTQDASGIHMVADGDGLGNGDYEFDLPWKAKSFTADQTNRDVRFVFTDNGAVNYIELDVLHPKSPVPTSKGFPVAMVTLRGPNPDPEEPFVCTRGTWTPITVSREEGWTEAPRFTIALSTSPEGFAGYWAEHEVADVTRPVPTTWQLDTKGFDGLFGTTGQAVTTPTVFVPLSATLAGKEFWLALLLLDADGAVLCVGGPVKVLIN